MARDVDDSDEKSTGLCARVSCPTRLQGARARKAAQHACRGAEGCLPAHHASRQPLRGCGARAAPWLTVALRRLKSPPAPRPHPRHRRCRRVRHGEGFRIARWIRAACGRLRPGSSLAAAAVRGVLILWCSGFRAQGSGLRAPLHPTPYTSTLHRTLYTQSLTPGIVTSGSRAIRITCH